MQKTRPSISVKADRKILISFGAVILVFTLTVALSSVFLYSRIQTEEEDRLAGVVASILNESISRISFSGKYHARLLLEDMKVLVPEIEYISVESEDGIVIAHSDPLMNDKLLSEAEKAGVARAIKANAPVVTEVEYRDQSVKEVIMPHRTGFDSQPSGVVRIGINVEKVRREQTINIFILILLIAVLTAAAMFVVVHLSRRFGGTFRLMAEQLRGIADSIPGVVFQFYIRGKEKGFTFVSQRSAEILGIDHDPKMFRQRFLSGLSEADARRFDFSFSESARTGGMLNFESSFTLNGNSNRCFRVLAHPAVTAEEILFSGVIMDTTEVVKAENERHAREEKGIRHAELLSEMIKTGIFSSSSIDEKFRIITELSGRLVLTERTSIWIYSDDYSEIRCVDLFFLSSGIHSKGESFSTSIFPGYTDSHKIGSVIAVENVHDDPRTSSLHYAYLSEWNIISLLDAPVWVEGRLKAVISFEQTQSRIWQLEDEQIAMTIASYVSNLLEAEERRKAEASLAASRAQLEVIIQKSPVGIAICSIPDWRNIAINERFTDYFGYTLNDIPAVSDWFPLAYPDPIYRQEVIADWNARLKASSGGDPFVPSEYRVTCKDGSVKSMQILASIIDSIAIISFVDLTQLGKAEAELRTSEQKFANIFDMSPDMIGITRMSDGVIRAGNPAMSLMTEFSHDELIGRSVLDLGIYRSESSRTEMINGLRTLGEVSDFEFELKTKNGNILTCLMSARPLVYDGEESVSFIIHDISRRKKAELALKDSEQRLRNIVHQLPMGMHIYEADENGNLYLVYANPAADAILRISNEELIGHCIVESFPRLRNTDVPDHLLRAARDGEQWNSEVANYNDHGFSGVFEVRAFQTSPGLVAMLFVDITDKKKADEERQKLQSQLVQAQKMESVGRLAGGVAHDFNNMLMVIMGRAEAAMMTLDKNSRIYSSLNEILKAGQRSADLTRQLLAFARKQIISPKVVDLNETVASMLNMLQRLIGENIELAWVPGRDLWNVKIDPSQVDQILANLVVNGRDAIQGNGRITIGTANMVFDKYRAAENAVLPGEYVEIAVEDNGVGMDKETQSHVFEPFFTTKEMGKGTGLGLATVYGIVTQNAGFIHLYSEPEHGTIFKIYFPREAALGESSAQREEDILPPGGSETILIVEDEASVLGFTEKLLVSLGYNVIPTLSPGKAVEIAASHDSVIDLLLTDLIMPEMNGRDLSKIIASLRPEIKSLFMSGYTADMVAHRGILDEGVNFIQKPFSVRALAEEIRKILDQQV